MLIVHSISRNGVIDIRKEKTNKKRLQKISMVAGPTAVVCEWDKLPNFVVKEFDLVSPFFS